MSGSAHAGGGGYERRDADVKVLAWLLVVLLAGTGLAAYLMDLLYGHFAARAARSQAPPATLAGPRSAMPPEPRLQNTPFDDLQRLQAEEDEALSTYGWVDRSSGIVRLPIEKALEIAASGGIPAAAPGAPEPGGAAADPSAGAPAVAPERGRR